MIPLKPQNGLTQFHVVEADGEGHYNILLSTAMRGR